MDWFSQRGLVERMATLVGLLTVYAACALTAPAPAVAQDSGRESAAASQVREGMLVERIDVRGNRRVEAQSIRSQLRTKINAKLSAEPGLCLLDS